jgi:hypothetical protein
MAAPSGPPAAVVAAPASVGDVPVASVGGRPVFGSCVAAQVARGAPTRQHALDECIAFELLAQEAEARGLATDPEVFDETRRALVSRLVELEFERRYQSADDLRDAIEPRLAELRPYFAKPEFRTSAYARVLVDEKQATPDDVARARTIAEQIHAALAGETGLLFPHLEATARRIAEAAGARFDVKLVPPRARGIGRRWDEAFEAALFAIPEVGRVSSAVRTEWGWDVLLLLEIDPARTLSHDDVVPGLFARARHERFAAWIDELVKQRKIQIDKDEAVLDQEAP